MKLLITVEGKQYEVDVQVLDGSGAAPAAPHPVSRAAVVAPPPSSIPASAPAPAPAPAAPAAGGAKALKAPIVGTVIAVKVKAGDVVTRNQTLLVMEAMKMETNVASPQDGTIAAVKVNAGESVKAGQVLLEFA